MRRRELATDVLVIGNGGAGLRATPDKDQVAQEEDRLDGYAEQGGSACNAVGAWRRRAPTQQMKV